MTRISSDDLEKVQAYLSVINDRIVAAIRTTGIRNYCTATLLILYAAIDGLGKLIAMEDNAGVDLRIKAFLDFMGGNYSTHKKELLKLRHSLVHNAINQEAFLSNDEIEGATHLEIYGKTGFVFVNTTAYYNDFMDAYERFRSQIMQDPMMMKRSAERLMWKEGVARSSNRKPKPSPPPAVYFINTR